MSNHSKVNLLGMQLDALDMQQAVDTVWQWREANQPATCRYVVTPNVDHAVMLQANRRLQDAYAGAGLVLADGAPIVWASRLLRRPVPERVAGSDLAPALFAHAARLHAAGTLDQPLRVFLLGAAPGVADRAAGKIAHRWPGVEIAGTLSPPLGFEHDAAENQRIVDAVNAAAPDVVLLGLGAPKQELWISEHASQLRVPAVLCIGATIDFLAGEKRRAPRWMQRVGLEWFHRLATEPRRLAARYARDAWVFPRLLWRDWRGC
ncbi:MAG: glycosyltransferase [Planctomycetaceae bacterium]|nr:glycosyltransferase [Planctomycetaceae bacterium]